MRAALHDARFLPAPVAVFLYLTLVMLFLALGDTHFHLDLAPEPVHGGWHNGFALAVNQRTQALQFAPVEQQFARAHGLWRDMSTDRRQRVDLRADQKGLTIADEYIAVRKLDAPFAQGLYFPALERNAGFQSLFDVVIEAGALVKRNRVLAGLAHGHGRRLTGRYCRAKLHGKTGVHGSGGAIVPPSLSRSLCI